MRVVITDEIVGEWTANYIVNKINAFNPTKEKPFVLGLPTGGTPIPMYRKLVEYYKDGKVSFENVVTFNMDEYIGISYEHEQSYHYFMNFHFFNHVNIPRENINILDGNAKDLKEECQLFEEKIKKYGGVDLFVGGVGSDGHIAFNEPASSLNSRTRIKSLTYETLVDNSRFFKNDINQVPKQALTVGIGTILDAKEIVIMVEGSNKAKALAEGIEGSVSQMCGLSALQLHKKSLIVADEKSCVELKVKTYNNFKEIEKENIKIKL